MTDSNIFVVHCGFCASDLQVSSEERDFVHVACADPIGRTTSQRNLKYGATRADNRDSAPLAPPNLRGANGVLRDVLVFGLVLLFVGGVVAGLTYPHSSVSIESSSFGSTTTDVTNHGSRVGFILALFVIATGQLLALVGLVGFGVKLGMKARDEDRASY